MADKKPPSSRAAMSRELARKVKAAENADPKVQARRQWPPKGRER